MMKEDDVYPCNTFTSMKLSSTKINKGFSYVVGVSYGVRVLRRFE